MRIGRLNSFRTWRRSTSAARATGASFSSTRGLKLYGDKFLPNNQELCLGLQGKAMTMTKMHKPIWGASNIAERIDRTRSATFHLLETGSLPGQKIGGRWCVTEEILDNFFAAATNPAPAFKIKECAMIDDPTRPGARSIS